MGTVQERIVVDPQICGGQPCILGTRIMVKNILGMLAGGYGMEQILHAYPELSREDVSPALDYATAVVDEEKVAPLAPSEPGNRLVGLARGRGGPGRQD